MNRLLIVLTILVLLSAMLIYDLNRRLYGSRVPEGFNPNSTFAYQVVGFTYGIAKDLSSIIAFLGLMDYHVAVRKCYALTTYITLNSTFPDQLEINNTEIFGVGVRIYKPLNKTKDEERKVQEELMPALIYYHGGGWSIGSLDSFDVFLRRLAVMSQVVVISVDYRQAPEYIYPSALTDCYNVAVGLLNNGSQYGVDVKRIMVAGDSAGGNMAASVTHNLAYVAEKHCSRQYLAGQILLYPSVQMLDLNLPSYIENNDSAILCQRDVADFISLYLTGNTDLTEAILAGNHSKHLENTTYMSYVRPKQKDTDKTKGKDTEMSLDDDEEEEEEVVEMIVKPKVDLGINGPEALISIKGSPLMAKNFRGTPQTLLITAEFDPLRDEGFLYAKRLQKAGVNLVHKNYKSFHGFVTLTSEPWPYPFGTEEAYQAVDDIVKFLQRLKKN